MQSYNHLLLLLFQTVLENYSAIPVKLFSFFPGPNIRSYICKTTKMDIEILKFINEQCARMAICRQSFVTQHSDCYINPSL